MNSTTKTREMITSFINTKTDHEIIRLTFQLSGTWSKSNKSSEEYEKIFRNELIKHSDYYHILPSILSNGKEICLLSRQKDAVMMLDIRDTPERYASHLKSSKTLVLHSLHSFKLGEGRKLMEIYKKMSRKLELAGSTCCETVDLIPYYEKYGFIYVGALGLMKEHFLIRPYTLI